MTNPTAAPSWLEHEPNEWLCEAGSHRANIRKISGADDVYAWCVSPIPFLHWGEAPTLDAAQKQAAAALAAAVGGVRAPGPVYRSAATPQELALDGLKDAIAFYDRVRASPLDEQSAVGADHWERLVDAARKAAAFAPRILPD